MARLAYIALGSLALAACGDDPVSYSEPVGINLKAKSSDTINNVVTDDKGINTESGNPYGAFVSSGYPLHRSSSRKGTGVNFG